MRRSVFPCWLTTLLAWALLLTPAAWATVDPVHLVAHLADHSHEPVPGHGHDHDDHDDHDDHRHPAEPPDDIASRDASRPLLQLPVAMLVGILATVETPTPPNAFAASRPVHVPPATPVSLAVRLTL